LELLDFVQLLQLLVAVQGIEVQAAPFAKGVATSADDFFNSWFVLKEVDNLQKSGKKPLIELGALVLSKKVSRLNFFLASLLKGKDVPPEK